MGIWVHPYSVMPLQVGGYSGFWGRLWWAFLLLCLLVSPPDPFRLHLTIITYVCKVFQHLEMLWLGIWVYPYSVTPVQVGGGFGGFGGDLGGWITSPGNGL